MALDKENEKVFSKVAVKNKKPMMKILVFAVCLIVLVGILTVGRSVILERDAASKVTQSVETGKGESATKKDATGLNFQEMNYDIADWLDSDIVKDLPTGAAIELKLGDDYYTITKNSISAGRPANPDLTISLPVTYAKMSGGMCETIKKANDNRDLSVEMHSSQTALMWKYRGMLKYRDCLG